MHVIVLYARDCSWILGQDLHVYSKNYKYILQGNVLSIFIIIYYTLLGQTWGKNNFLRCELFPNEIYNNTIVYVD